MQILLCPQRSCRSSQSETGRSDDAMRRKQLFRRYSGPTVCCRAPVARGAARSEARGNGSADRQGSPASVLTKGRRVLASLVRNGQAAGCPREIEPSFHRVRERSLQIQQQRLPVLNSQGPLPTSRFGPLVSESSARTPASLRAWG